MLGSNDVLGHERMKEYFRSAAQIGEISHTRIPGGETGMGRKSLTNVFVLSLLCEKGVAKPCMRCHVYRQALPGDHLDLIYVIHEKPANIDVDDIREWINDTIQVRLYSNYYRIYIMDEVEKMTVQAQNVPLKTIEEPPVYAVILLSTANQDASLPTILSRYMQLKLRPLKDSVVREYLARSLGESESEIDIYVAFVRGNLGKIIHLTQPEELGVMHREMLHLLKHTKGTDIFRLLDYTHKVKEGNSDVRERLDFMRIWYRDILMYRTMKDANLLMLKNEFSAVRSISITSGYGGLERILEAIDKVRTRLDANTNTELVMELMLLAMKEDWNVLGL